MNRKYDYRAIELEYVAGDMSVRALARRHGIPNASLVHAQAKRLSWYEKRDTYRQRAGAKTIERLTDGEARRAQRVFEVEDHAVEVIDQALTRMQEDMARTKVVQRGDQWFEEPIYIMGPKEIVLLIDRLAPFLDARSAAEQRPAGMQVLFAQPVDLLEQFAALTRRRPSTPSSPRVLPDGPTH